MNSTTAPALAAASKVIDTRAGFAAAVHEGVGAALSGGVRRMFWADADFGDWPLDDPALLQSLANWLRLPQRQLVLLAGSYDLLSRQRPRFAAQYRLWAHAIQACAPADDELATLPSILLAEPALAVQLIDPIRWRGRVIVDAEELRQWHDRIDAILQRATPAFAATTLGL
jgi:hypothetical protein